MSGKIKLKLIKRLAGYYLTEDGQWNIFQETYSPKFWFVNRHGYDETEVAEGFKTKYLAVDYLTKRLTLMNNTPQMGEIHVESSTKTRKEEERKVG